MPSDIPDHKGAPDVNEADATHVPEGKLSPKGVSAMQGRDVSSAEKGSDFENWAKEDVFHGDSRRLNVPREYNEHLTEVDDEGLGLKKTSRYSDAYVDEDGFIQELKAGYEKGGIDPDQARDYSLMQDAGHVYERVGTDDVKRTDINGVNYIFDGETGAEANRSELEQYGFGILYRDENGKLQHLKDK